jgi:hypothetical protein
MHWSLLYHAKLAQPLNSFKPINAVASGIMHFLQQPAVQHKLCGFLFSDALV